jgi:tetrahydromethanopterin S-methyltransferase subunit C
MYTYVLAPSEFEPTIPVFERATTFCALDGAATVIGLNLSILGKLYLLHTHIYFFNTIQVLLFSLIIQTCDFMRVTLKLCNSFLQ